MAKEEAMERKRFRSISMMISAIETKNERVLLFVREYKNIKNSKRRSMLIKEETVSSV